MPNQTIAATATQVTTAALASLRAGRHVVVRAHAGAGKTGGLSSGTVRMAAELAHDGWRVALLVAQNDQVVETLHRLTRLWPNLTTTFVAASASWGRMPADIRERRSRPANLAVARSGGSAADQNSHRRFRTSPGLYVMTVDKFRFLAPAGTDIGGQRLTLVEPFDAVIVDEAWMAPAALWVEALRHLTGLVALIGDPGQILPWQPDSVFYAGMRDSPVEPLPEHVVRQLPGRVDTFELAVTRRNPSHTTAVTGRLPAYAAHPTVPMFDAVEVPVTLGARPLRPDATDRAVAAMATNGLALQRLPAGVAPQNDPMVAAACADAVARLLARGAMLGHPVDGDRPLTAAAVGVLVAHHDQRVAVLDALSRLGLTGPHAPRVATFNVIQGATLAVSVVWHPLSGRTDVSTFHADTGRLTVGLTRHTHGCLLVGRADIGDRLIGAAASDDLEGDATDGRHAGLVAHTHIWSQLSA